MAPGPIPTFTAFAPASINIAAASPVAMLPAITCNPLCAFDNIRTVSITPR
jgi:hypothetical protein